MASRQTRQTRPAPSITVTVTVTEELGQDMIMFGDVSLLITRSELGSVLSADVPCAVAAQGTDDEASVDTTQRAIAMVLGYVELLVPEAVVITIVTSNSHPSAQRNVIVTHWQEEDEQNVREVLKVISQRAKIVTETEVMKRMDYTLQRARQVLSGNPKMNVETLQKLARAVGLVATVSLHEDPNFNQPRHED